MNYEFRYAMIKGSDAGSIVFTIMGLYKNFSVKRWRLRDKPLW